MDRVLYFAAGVISGGIGTYIILARKFERDFQEATIEINEELRKLAESKHEEQVGEGTDSPSSEPDPEQVVSDTIDEYSPSTVEDPDQGEVVKRTMDRQRFEAYVITEEEFKAKGHQEHIFLKYYMEDDVFADDRGVPLQNTEWFDNIISGVPASVSIIHIRSMSRHADFEVELVDDSYEHSVLGVQPYEDE